MNVLIYRYGSICEPDIITACRLLGLDVIEETTEITEKSIPNSRRVELVEAHLQAGHPLFVFSINFYPAIAQICHIYRTPYLCWTVDSPVPELFSDAIRLDTNYIFLFDRAQYGTFARYNPEHIFHLPLASATERFDQVTSRITPADRSRYSCEISFVGSLYSEKNPLKGLHLSDYAHGYIRGLTAAALQLAGFNPVEDALADSVVREIKDAAPNFYSVTPSVAGSDRYVAAHSYIGYQIAETERIRTLNALAEHFAVDLFTGSDTSPLTGVRTHGTVHSLDEMPKIFHLSKINLNMTIKPIQTGLPLRVFDILGCGGFLMTNYQPELTEHFELGTDLEAYSSLEELQEKCAWYLVHDVERERIARSGYEKVKAHHTYYHRLNAMIRQVSGET